jgi:erythritol kinase (D-erythritol 1-phosphate-forming)
VPTRIENIGIEDIEIEDVEIEDMDEGIIVGIDAGTSVIKSVAFAVDGRQLAVAAIANQYVTSADGGVTQDMTRTWVDAAATLKQLTEKIPNLAARLIAISVTAQGDGLWLIDMQGEPVGPAAIWLDNRCASIVDDYVASNDYASHYERTGTGLTVVQMSGKLAWLQRHEPEVLARATHAFHCKDWLYFKLTGDRMTDPSEANCTFGNFRTNHYQADILDHMGVANGKPLLTPVVDGTQAGGRLTEAAAKLTGLKTGTPVCLGFVDYVCTGLGGGLFDPSGQTGCTIIGSTGMHMRLRSDRDKVQLNPEKSGFTVTFPAPGMVAQMHSNMAATLNIDWLLDVAIGILADQGLRKSRADLLEGLDDKVLAREAAKLLYHPYISWAGERSPFMDTAARAMFNGLDTTADYYDMMRSVFEGLAFAARDCYEAMGTIPKEVRVTGGAAKSKALRLILASVLQADIRTVSREEAGAAGAAMIAAVQQKLFADMAACAKAWVDPHIGPSTTPDAALARRYEHTFPSYVAARKAMRPIWRDLRRT